jgi:hypothetical protein
MTKHDNPKAFPLPHFEQNGKFFYQDGMTLRDWFAGQAMAALITKSPPTFEPSGATHLVRLTATGAYDYADAMLAARAAITKARIEESEGE